MSSVQRSAPNEKTKEEKNQIRSEMYAKFRHLMRTIKSKVKNKNRGEAAQRVSSMGKLVSKNDSKFARPRKLIMSNNTQNPQQTGFDFIGEPSQVENVEQVSQNRANMENMIQDQPSQPNHPDLRRHPENPNHHPENVSEPVNQTGPSQGFDSNRMGDHTDRPPQSREIPVNRQPPANFQEHPPGRNVAGNMVANHQNAQQMEMNPMQMGRQGQAYYQAQKYHHMQENPSMANMRSEVVMPNNYRQQPQAQEMYNQAMANRQYMQNPAYKQQMMGPYYENHSSQMQPQVTQETFERISNLERVYFEILREPVRITPSHGQWFANYRGTKVPIARMNEYVNSVQKGMGQREYQQAEYYAQSQAPQQDFHLNQVQNRMNPAYKNQQMAMGYRFPNGGHYDHHQFAQSRCPD